MSSSTQYHDNFFDRLFIALFSYKMSNALGQRSSLKGYEGFVDLSQKIMRGRNAQEQQAIVSVVLKSLVPSPILTIVRTWFSPTPLVCELNAWFATVLFEWLVGPCEVRSVEIPVEIKPETIPEKNTSPPSKIQSPIQPQSHSQIQSKSQLKSDRFSSKSPRLQKSGVHIQKCRYLEQSRCVGMCINMCKLPTQEFFTKEFGIPLTMTPNFEDFSCEMVFGQIPPRLEEEEAYQQPCLKEHCPTASGFQEPCPKVRSNQHS